MNYINHNHNNFSCASQLYFFPQVLFYSIFTYYTISFINYINEKTNEKTNKKTNDESKELQETQHRKLDFELLGSGSSSRIEDLEEIKKQQDILDNMLSKNSLERAFILYYIFEIKGNYKVLTTDRIENGLEQELIEEYNTYDELEKIWVSMESINLYENCPESDETICIGDKTYNIDSSQLIFISWLYSSGVYDFLTKNPKIKSIVLKQMNDAKLLRGNVFLRYHLQDL